jgi:hypothetical protein
MHAQDAVFAAGQQWSYRAPAGFDASRLVIGAIAEFAEGRRVACCAVWGAPAAEPDGRLRATTIPFLPLSLDALTRTVVAPDGEGELPEAFVSAFEAWRDDPRGLAVFTVPFDGQLDQLIARQMAEIVGVDPV